MTDVRARTTTGARNGLRYLIYGFGLLLALLTASCGNGIFQVGTPVITLTAKPGRFASYIVTIDAIQLTRQDGGVIELPATSQRVDLANLSAYANLLEAPAAQIGTYVSATFVLDYSAPQAAEVYVKSNGSVVGTTLYDAATKTTPTTETIVVQFDPNHPFVINDQQSTVMAIDIDLEASNIIGVPDSTGKPQVTVKPFWNITAQPAYDKPVFARGLYVLADLKNNNLVMNVRPLHDVINSPFGALKVNVNDQTYYNVNGAPYTGAAGLAAVNSLQNVYADLQVAAYGPPTGNPFSDLSTITPQFTATQVYVGSSFESTLEDQITGVVSAISSNVLTVKGAAFVDRVGDFGFAENVPVTVGPNTIYSTDGANNGPTLSSISVGQVVTVLGVSSNNGTTVDPTGMDATSTVVPGAQVRLQNSPLLATFVSAASANTATVNLVTLDHYEPTKFSFTGTGTPNADPANYVITTPTDLTGTAPGTVLNINGMTTAFGQGPPYFTASAVAPDTGQELIIEWASTGSTNPFTVVNQSGINVNLADPMLTTVQSGATVGTTTGRAVIVQGPLVLYDLLGANKPPNPTLLPITYNTTDPLHPPVFGVGSVAAGANIEIDPGTFASKTQTVANGTTAIMKLVAYGQYDPNTGNFAATRITINSQ
jgi:uncharacterized protein DUF4382